MPQVLSVLRKRPRASRSMLLPVSTPHGSAAGRASSVHSLGGGRASGSPQGGVSDAQQVSANSNLSPVLSLGSAEGHSRGSEHTEAGRHLFGAYGRQRVVQVFSTGQPQLPTCHRPPKTPPESWVERFLRVTGMEPVVSPEQCRFEFGHVGGGLNKEKMTPPTGYTGAPAAGCPCSPWSSRWSTQSLPVYLWHPPRR